MLSKVWEISVIKTYHLVNLFPFAVKIFVQLVNKRLVYLIQKCFLFFLSPVWFIVCHLIADILKLYLIELLKYLTGPRINQAVAHDI